MKSGRVSAACLVLVVSCLVLAMQSVVHIAKAETTGPDWVGGQLKYELDRDYKYESDDGYDLFPNIQSRSVEALRNTSNNTLVQNLVKESHPTYPSSVGDFSSTYVLPTGESRWQKLDLGIFDAAMFYPNPGDAGVVAQMYYNSFYNTDKKFIRYIPDWRQAFGKYSADGAGNITRYIVDGYDINASTTTLLNPDGSRMVASRSIQTSFSKNGRWAFMHTPAGDLRVSIPNLKYRVLSPVWNERNMVVSSAVSNTGRFVAVGGVARELYVFDSDLCSSDTSGDCKKSGSITQFAKDEYVKSLGAEYSPVEVFNLRGVKFVNESKLEMYFEVVFKDKTLKYERIYVSTDPGPQTTRYLAMGDSFSSGEGVGDYYEATNFYADDNNHNKCHQSRQAYSEILNKVLTPDWYDSIACSGAMMKDVVYVGDDVNYFINTSQAKFNVYGENDIERELNISNNLKKLISNLAPGYVPQNSILISNPSSVTTISLGGNDIGFGNIVKDCIWKSECYSSRDDREKLADSIASKIPYLTKTYETILRNMTGEDKRLYVIGYPQLVNENTTCGSFMGGNERVFANNLVDYLNATIKIAAEDAGARFITTRDAFVDYDIGEDYRICGNSTQAVNGLKGDIINSSDNQPIEYYLSQSYHPNKLGNALLAKRINLYTNGFQLDMPKRTPAGRVPGMDIYARLVGDKEDRVQIVGVINDSITSKTTYLVGGKVEIDHKNSFLDIPITGQAEVIVYSDPVHLGYITPSPDGSLTGEFELPAGIEPGIHEIHLRFTDISGERHDIYKHIMVIHSYDDYDGDGIKNDDEICAIGGAMGRDADRDGVDDACDPDLSTVVDDKADTVEKDIPTIAIVNEQSDASSNAVIGRKYTVYIEGLDNEEMPMPTSGGVGKPETARKADSTPEKASSIKGEDYGIQIYVAVLAVVVLGLISYIIYKRKRLGP